LIQCEPSLDDPGALLKKPFILFIYLFMNLFNTKVLFLYPTNHTLRNLREFRAP